MKYFRTAINLRQKMALRRNFILPNVVLIRHRAYTRRNGENTGPNASRDGSAKAEATAYEVLGLPESCSEASIRRTFRQLAKATHPDLQSDSSTAHFIRILAAYEILSDPRKREEYNKHLKEKRAVQYIRRNVSQFGHGNVGFDSNEFYKQEPAISSTEVVSWLRSYRAMIKDVMNLREIGVEKGWEEEFRGEMQSALKRAYFGPPVSEQQGLPECFEAEERAEPGIEDVLHLVSGRQLFGVVRQIQHSMLEGHREAPFLPQTNTLECQRDYGTPDLHKTGSASFTDDDSIFSHSHPSFANSDRHITTNHSVPGETACVDLELQLFGNVVARSIRVPFQHNSVAGTSTSDECDTIYIYLSSDQVEDTSEFVNGTVADDCRFSRVLLGTIRGLSSTAVGNVCFAHGPDGKKTHLILQHSTPLVKHMQWFRVGEETASCECRCRRASTVPSRYWLFEPRTDTHNVGGWYIETFKQSRSYKRSNRGKHPRKMDRNSDHMFQEESHEMPDLVHPAMYIMAAAYKTLDEEVRAAQRREASLPKRIIKLVDTSRIASGFSHWWKQRWNPSN